MLASGNMTNIIEDDASERLLEEDELNSLEIKAIYKEALEFEFQHENRK